MCTKELLEQCADLVIRTTLGDASGDIACCRFSCLRVCEVLRHVSSDTELELDCEGRHVVPMPNVEHNILQIALDLVHGLRTTADLSIQECEQAQQGMRVLGCTVLDAPILQRVWHLVAFSHDLSLIVRHAPAFLRAESYRVNALSRMVQLAPMWSDFCDTVLSQVEMDCTLAKFIMPYLMRIFPAGLVFRALLELIPAATLSGERVLDLLGTYATGVYYHPLELEEVLLDIQKLWDRQRWDGITYSALRTLYTALISYEMAPISASKLFGTVITYERSPAASAVIRVDTRLKRRTVTRVAPWLRMQIDPLLGSMVVWVTMNKLDDMACAARGMQMRVMTTAGDSGNGGGGETGVPVRETAETWYIFDAITTYAQPMSSETCTRTFGQTNAMRANVQSRRLRSIRVDLFYASHSVLVRPFL